MFQRTRALVRQRLSLTIPSREGTTTEDVETMPATEACWWLAHLLFVQQGKISTAEAAAIIGKSVSGTHRLLDKGRKLGVLTLEGGYWRASVRSS